MTQSYRQATEDTAWVEKEIKKRHMAGEPLEQQLLDDRETGATARADWIKHALSEVERT